MSRRGLLIRLLIFVPLFAYFGFGAVQKCRHEQEAAQQADEAADYKKTKHQLPNGQSIEVIELTPEQAAKLGYTPPEIGKADKTPTPDATAPDVKAPEAAPDAKAPDAKAN
jgi:hypothetical protein